MPIFVYQCEDGHRTELYFPKHVQVSRGCGHRSRQGVGGCDLLLKQIITPPALIAVCADVRYDSPITGEPITSWHAREEDMKRHDCRPYDPDLKIDVDRRVIQREAELDKAIDATVEEAVEKMSTTERGHLASELLDKSATVEYARGALHAG